MSWFTDPRDWGSEYSRQLARRSFGALKHELASAEEHGNFGRAHAIRRELQRRQAFVRAALGARRPRGASDG